MNVEQANAHVLDVPLLLPAGTKRSECKVAEVLCADGPFAAVRLENGKYAGLWPSHVDVVDTFDKLNTKIGDEQDPLLNYHERMLLEFRVNR